MCAQVFIGRGEGVNGRPSVRAQTLRDSPAGGKCDPLRGSRWRGFFYVPSMSCRTLIYKGMLTPRQLATFYPDLSDPLIETAIAVVHSRFSTNTFPSWGRAHPYRYLIHNGEINTLRGNENWMYARQGMVASELFGDDLKSLPDHSGRRQRLGQVRQLPRVPGSKRALFAACGHDDDSRSRGRIMRAWMTRSGLSTIITAV